MTVQLRYPACLLGEVCLRTSLAPQVVHLLGSATDVVAAALAAGSLAGLLLHRREAAELAAESWQCGVPPRLTHSAPNIHLVHRQRYR